MYCVILSAFYILTHFIKNYKSYSYSYFISEEMEALKIKKLGLSVIPLGTPGRAGI